MSTGGDSGGGACVQRNGSWYLAGITSESWYDLSQSTLDIYYRCTGGWTRVAVYADWIRTQLKQ